MNRRLSTDVRRFPPNIILCLGGNRSHCLLDGQRPVRRALQCRGVDLWCACRNGKHFPFTSRTDPAPRPRNLLVNTRKPHDTDVLAAFPGREPGRFVQDPSIRSRWAASANARKSRSRVRRGTPPSMQLWAISASPRRALRRFASTFARNSPARCQ
jgi:hypothetical protein